MSCSCVDVRRRLLSAPTRLVDNQVGEDLTRYRVRDRVLTGGQREKTDVAGNIASGTPFSYKRATTSIRSVLITSGGLKS